MTQTSTTSPNNNVTITNAKEPQRVGFFQTIQVAQPIDGDSQSELPSSVTIHDDLHGTHTITEPVLIAILLSTSFLRLASIGQHGISNLLGINPAVTRYEHSVGACLIVRAADASLGEQVAALLHDVSHTVLSHDVDWALSKPGQSFHEDQKDRFIAMTDLPAILAKHGFEDLKPLHEELYPLVEWPAPGLCADRLDYAVRDSVAFGTLSRQDARRILTSIKAYPDATSPDRFLVIQDQDLALILSRAYLASDRDIWSNPAHVALSRHVGSLIAAAVGSGRISEQVLWSLSDHEFWGKLRAVAGPEELQLIHRIESDKQLDDTGLRLPRAAKVRVLNPDVSPMDAAGSPKPLSKVSPVWAQELQAYVDAREALREQS
jgi:HD superfamily phosphohydrolase